MVWDPEDGNRSTYKPPTAEQMEQLRRAPQPGLQIVPQTPTQSINEIGRRQPTSPVIRERVPVKAPVYH